MPLQQTSKRPVLSLQHSRPKLPNAQLTEVNEPDHAVHEFGEDLAQYPVELLQSRIQMLQEYLSEHYPSTLVYIMSLVLVLVILIIVLATMLTHHVSDGRPWILVVIAIMVLLFIAKMSFLSRMEKVHKNVTAVLQSFNDQDMPRYGVLYRLRSREPCMAKESSWIVRFAYRINLGLPYWAVDLTTIDHIDEHSFREHSTSDTRASTEGIPAREIGLPTYRLEVYEGHKVPPKYEAVVDIDDIPTQPTMTHL